MADGNINHLLWLTFLNSSQKYLQPTPSSETKQQIIEIPVKK
jgi:hypothetical protein